MSDTALIQQFLRLTRHTRWAKLREVKLQFNNHHAQGMVRIGELYYLSSVELFEWPKRVERPDGGLDISPGKGQGHLFVFDGEGRLIQDILLGEGDIYHPGGIDYDGEHIWVPVAEYRPYSRSIIYKVDPVTSEAEVVFSVADHIGGVARNGQNGELIGNSWGSRRFYKWTPEGTELHSQDNSSHLVDYQDGHYAGDGKMIVSGISELAVPSGWDVQRFELGGMALIDMETLATLHEVPVGLFSPDGHVVTRNPVFLESVENGLRLYAVPDDNDGAMLIYETIHA